MSSAGPYANQSFACHSRQTTMPALHHFKFFTGRMLFLMPNLAHWRQCENLSKAVAAVVHVIAAVAAVVRVIAAVVAVVVFAVARSQLVSLSVAAVHCWPQILHSDTARPPSACRRRRRSFVQRSSGVQILWRALLRQWRSFTSPPETAFLLSLLWGGWRHQWIFQVS